MTRKILQKLFSCALFLLLFAVSAMAQAPNSFNYQAVVRNASGEVIAGTEVSLRLSINKGGALGTPVFVETHKPTTNTFGLVSLAIGSGTVVTGNISLVDWAADTYFLKVEMDATGGSTYTELGVSQILSVPYSMHAKESQILKGSITESQVSDLKNYLTDETDPVFNTSPAQGITGSNITNWNTAFGWGNHTGLYRPISYVPAWGEITSKPSTLGGYGISDAMGTSHPANAITGTNITNWNTAFGWGNHSGLYRPISWVPSWMDVTDKPSFALVATSGSYNDLLNLPALNINDWNTAFDWGNHAGLYRPVSWVPSWADVTGKPATFPPSAHSHSTVDITSGIFDAALIPTLDIGTKTSGTLSVARGGTGATTFTSGNVLIGSGTGAITTLSRSGIDTRATYPPDAHTHAATDISSGTLNIARIPTGTTASTVSLGNHTHGSITNTGSIGSASGRIVTTGASGALQATAGTTAGQMLYWNGTAWVNVAAGSEGQVLTFTGGLPTWSSAAITIAGPTDAYNPITNKIWMDRNLGATQVATSSTDANSYGHLYQWGRGTDGHQVRTSGTTTTLSSSNSPGHANFILAPSSPYDWRSPQNDNLWQGVSGVNNPCPSGYRLPTEAEWNVERLSWSSNNAAGAFASPLKLPVAGFRHYSSGSLLNVGTSGSYWSSTVSSTSSRDLAFGSGFAIMGSSSRAFGLSVRCIKQ